MKKTEMLNRMISMLSGLYLFCGVLFAPAVLFGADMIVDNQSPANFSVSGTWASSTYVSGYYGSNYQWSNAGSGSNTATYTFSISSSGSYDISAWWTSEPERAPDAPYTILNNGVAIATVKKNQRVNGGKFNLLGSYSLSAGTLTVRLTNAATSGFVIADAVKVSTAASSNLLAVVDNGASANFSVSGTWASSSYVSGITVRTTNGAMPAADPIPQPIHSASAARDPTIYPPGGPRSLKGHQTCLIRSSTTGSLSRPSRKISGSTAGSSTSWEVTV